MSRRLSGAGTEQWVRPRSLRLGDPPTMSTDYLFKTSIPSEGILLITLTRPRKKNAINSTMYLELAEVFRKEGENEATSVIILTGEGDYFSSGADLTDDSWTPSVGEKMNESPAAVFMRAIAAFPKLVVAAVNGPAVGVAVTLLCQVDMVYAVPEATFWTPFLRMAIVPEYASSVLFPAVMGRSKACEMLFLGKKMTAHEAQVANLVSEVIPSPRLLPEILMRLQDMLSKPLAAKSVLVFKALMQGQRRDRVDDVIAAEFAEFDRRIADGDVVFAITQLLQSKL